MQTTDDDYFAQLSEQSFAYLPLHHESKEAAQAHAERKGFEVYQDLSGSYFTAPHGYVPLKPMTFDDEKIVQML